MICLYCNEDTKVINSRLQKRTNDVWRRRACTNCSTIFTTIESPNLEQAWRVQDDGQLEPFLRYVLFLSIYGSIRHRPKAAVDAEALTNTVISQIRQLKEPTVSKSAIRSIALEVLSKFDNVAATHYQAFHR